VFGDLELDFVVLCSSMYAISGEFGQVDYTAANNFLDAYARGAHGWRAPVVSVNWGGWLEVGMAVEVAAPAVFRALQRGERMTPLSHPILTSSYAGENGAPGWCSGLLSPEQHWVLADHHVAGVPVVPGTAHLESVRRAFEETLPAPSPRHVVELRDVAFIDPLSVPEGSSAELQVVFETALDGLDFQVVSMAGGTRRTHAVGSVNWAESDPPPPADIEEIRRRCSIAVRDGKDALDSGSGMLTFGPHWGNIRTVHEGQQEELAFLVANDTAAADLANWGIYPSLLDEATAFGRTAVGTRVLPLGYGRITIRGPLPARFYSHLRHRDTGTIEVAARDLSLYDESGRELVAISDFTLRQIDTEALTTKLTASPVTGDTPSGLEVLAGGATEAGISPADGAEAFRRVVSTRLGGQVSVSILPIAEVIASAKAFTHEVIEEELEALSSGQRAERSVADGYVAPRTELEATLARIWGEGLGIGGDSLTAVQLLAMVQKELGVRLPMRSIFEDPTIAGAVARIEQIQAAGSSPTGQPDATKPVGTPAAGVSSTIPRLQRPETTPAQPAISE
jgi:phthiocerol/phenolphthiocerol synthesis type-I polyketide synthase E